MTSPVARPLWEAEVGMEVGRRQSMSLCATEQMNIKNFFKKTAHEGMGKGQRLSFQAYLGPVLYP